MKRFLDTRGEKTVRHELLERGTAPGVPADISCQENLVRDCRSRSDFGECHTDSPFCRIAEGLSVYEATGLDYDYRVACAAHWALLVCIEWV
jgi:hypothetical protein